MWQYSSLIIFFLTVGNFAKTFQGVKVPPFEAVFQGSCEENDLCEQLCYNLHDGTSECDCRNGFKLNSDGYSCARIDEEDKNDTSILYEKEASFVAVLDDVPVGETAWKRLEESNYPQPDRGNGLEQEPPKWASMTERDFSNSLDANDDYVMKKNYYDFLPEESKDTQDYYSSGQKMVDKADALNYDKYKLKDYSVEQSIDVEEVGSESNESKNQEDTEGEFTSPGPNLEQKVPSKLPNLQATESLTPPCELDCGVGHCLADVYGGVPRCQCPIGRGGHHCEPIARVETARFHGSSWVGFAPLREAYKDVQLTLEFKTDALDGVLLVSGENDDLVGDFMAAVLVQGYVEFRWDCGSGSGVVRSPEKVRSSDWNRLTVYRHRWDAWLQLNDGHHVQGRSEGLFSRITFREPLYVGGSYNLTSLAGRLGVTSGLQGCVRRLQVNDHIYKFYTKEHSTTQTITNDYAAVDGFDISECIGEACNEVDCQHGGKCVASPRIDELDPSLLSKKTDTGPMKTIYPIEAVAYSSPILPTPICLCPLGYTGNFCEKQLNLEVPSFNGSSHLVFPALGASVLSWLEIEIVFKAAATEGVILYEGHRSDGSGDFISLAISEAHAILTIDLGSGPLTLRSISPIRPGLWHTARISRTGRRTWFYMDNDPAVVGTTPGAFTMLSLTQPLYLGAVPSPNIPATSIASKKNFIGCIQRLVISGRQIHLVSGAVSGSNVGSCDHPCSERPCENGGACEPNGASYKCKCPLGYSDDKCQTRIVTQVATPSFSGRSFLKYYDPEIMKRISGDKLHMWFRFRSVSPDGLLIWVGEEGEEELNNIIVPVLGDSLGLELRNGELVLKYNLGSGYAILSYNASGYLSDGEWHVARLARFERKTRLSVDEGPDMDVESPGDLVQLNVDSALYVGGRETFRGIHTGEDLSPGLNGCIADLTLATDYHVDLITQASAGQNIDYC